MIEMTLAEIAEVVGGVAHGDATVTGAAFVDTRTPQEGGLFVAIAGERVDGHEFAGRAVAAGAAAVLGSRPTDVPTVVVDDAVAALGQLARHVLERLDAVTVLALTGSQGKTGVKDFLAQILEAHGQTVATLGNLNNEIGVPLTVLRATPETRYLVVEMGARGIGHIAFLATIARPDVAAVLNVGSAHVGEFGSQQAIAQAKGELIEALPPSGTAVLNATDPLVSAMAARTSARVVTWGPDIAQADLAFVDVESDDLDRHRMTLVWRGEGPPASAPVSLREIGAHQVHNAAAAAAMALSLGLDLNAVATALDSARSRSGWRMEVSERSDGLLVINDAYNANPESMRAAIETLGRIGARSGRRTLAVLGEMLELGDESDAGHRLVGEVAATAHVDVVIGVGQAAKASAGAFATRRAAGQAVLAESRDEALAWLRQNVAAGDVVLVKASRGAALEVLAHDLSESGPDERTTSA